MTHPIPKKTAAGAGREPAKIGFSITNQHGEHYCCRAKGVSLQIKRGVVQMVEGKGGCFVWFDRCRVELRDGRRKLLYRLLTGSASSDGADLTIVAEVDGDIGGIAKETRTRGRLPRRSVARSSLKATRTGNGSDAKAA